MGSGPNTGVMSSAPRIHLLSYLFLQSMVMAHLDCTYNSSALLSCSWDADSNLISSPCYISANGIVENRDIKGFCSLTPSGNPRSCAINLTSDGKLVKEIWAVNHKLNMSVFCSNGIKKNISVTFLPTFPSYQNYPPVSTDIKMISNGVWKLTWDISHRANKQNIETEIYYKSVYQLWQDGQIVRVKNVTSLILHQLNPDTQYEAKLRVNQTDFPGGRWSDWGKPVQWTTPSKGHLDCTHNSFETVSCSWKAAKNFIMTQCYVLANVTNDPRHIQGICHLPPISDPRSCVITITVNGEHYRNAMTAAHLLNVSVICSVEKNINMTVTSLSNFQPFFNLRLDPPARLKITMIEDGTWNLTWINDHRNYIDNLETEVHFKPAKWSWKDAKRFTINHYDLSVLLRDLQPDTLYEAKVRVNQTDFKGGRWSEWSKPVEWTTPPKGIIGSTFSTPGVIAISVVLLIIVVTLCSSKRVKKIMWIGVPDPSPFFHPLIDTHKGNFKKWLSTPYVFSPFFQDPTPVVISPVSLNCSVEEQHLKSPPTSRPEMEKDQMGNSGSSFTNQEYFSSVYFAYDHFPSTILNQSLHSPTSEDMPLFEAEYLCAPQSLASFGVHNGSFEQDSPNQVMQIPVLVEVIENPECDDEIGEISCHQEAENVTEQEGKESSENQKENISSTTPCPQHHGGKPSKVANVAADYLSLKELNQKHCQWM
ncbi:interleukin-2 receptor subunit beta isoform 1-T2 [Anomaloglossus baeobatrachus]|uniref:interleukin-2 receptor subunit beta n=1 Tax=Anomaloglossus baeobatrachus TaxID=238106 RepID=UPI003F4FD018